MRLVNIDDCNRALFYKQCGGKDSLITVESAFNMLEELPTAYDIDKVIEELEENASRYTKKYVTPYGNNGYRDTKAISIHKAIEIVKQGCVSDDVCEWKYDKHFEFAKSKCGSIDTHRIEFKKLKYCPYCGKKIKAVE